MRIVLVLCSLAAQAFGQQCAATPEAAARAVIGSRTLASAGDFRVADMQVDVVMKRVWFRVVRCDDATAPAVLVPVVALLRSIADPVVQVSSSTPGTVATLVLIHPGDTVQAVFATPAVHMAMDATAMQPGAVGDVISLTLKRRAGQPENEPDHRMRGMVRADRTVEVQP